MATTTMPPDVIRTVLTSAAEKVYTEPIHQDDLTVIPAAAVRGGGGGGGGPEGPRGGKGGGFGVKAKPAGAFVIRQGKVRWQPAVELSEISGELALERIAEIVRLRLGS